MKQFLCFFLSFLILSLSACDADVLLQAGTEPAETEPSVVTQPTEETAPVADTEPVTEPATEPVTEPVTEPATEPAPTEPEHSDLYISGLSVEDVIRYFNEVCLDSEIINGGDPSFVQKWVVPIYYTVEGEYTEKDIAVLEDFAAWLNTVEGFPGIYQTNDPAVRNLRISFGDQQNMLNLMGSSFTNMDGAVTFWYNYNCINRAIICYRTDITQHVRNSVILEEIYNGLGPIQDTRLRYDSIIYQEYSEPQALTEIDELILKLLYHPDIQPGMNAAQCEEVIRNLYY